MVLKDTWLLMSFFILYYVLALTINFSFKIKVESNKVEVSMKLCHSQQEHYLVKFHSKLEEFYIMHSLYATLATLLF